MCVWLTVFLYRWKIEWHCATGHWSWGKERHRPCWCYNLQVSSGSVACVTLIYTILSKHISSVITTNTNILHFILRTRHRCLMNQFIVMDKQGSTCTFICRFVWDKCMLIALSLLSFELISLRIQLWHLKVGALGGQGEQLNLWQVLMHRYFMTEFTHCKKIWYSFRAIDV